MKTMLAVFLLTVVFLIGMVTLEKERTQGLNEIDVSYQAALYEINPSYRPSSGGKTSSSKDKDEEDSTTITVSIKGEVKKAGTYELDKGTYLVDLLEASGGVTANADDTAYNEYYLLEDGDELYIPKSNNNNKISINTADVQALDMLPGIGETLATRIIDYRINNGDFMALEQLRNVDGIGDSIFEKIKDLIRL